MTTYAVLNVNEGKGSDAEGLTLEAAFAHLMERAGTIWRFRRIDGVMRLLLTRTKPFPDLPFLYRDPQLAREIFPDYRSKNPNDDAACRAIMLEATEAGRDGWNVVAKERYSAESARCLVGTDNAGEAS
jgi:hypothetical protein